MPSLLKPARRRSMGAKELPPLRHGEAMTQEVFHERYQAMPAHARAELIGGIVHMASPQKRRHGGVQLEAAHWFASMRAGADGIFRSKIFPGLRLDADALFRRDGKRLLAVLREGLASKEHAAFVAKLSAARRRRDA